MTDQRAKILEKIKKIKAKAEGSDNPEEAATFATKMHDMMRDHQVEMAELELEVAIYETFEEHQKYFDGWRRELMAACSVTCSVHIVFNTQTKVVGIHGRKENYVACWEMFKWLESEVVRISRVLYPIERAKSRRAQLGLALGVVEKLREHRQKDKDNPALLPMVVERDNVKADFEEHHGVFETAAAPTVRPTVEARIGYQNADQIRIRKEVK